MAVCYGIRTQFSYFIVLFTYLATSRMFSNILIFFSGAYYTEDDNVIVIFML